jgi:hypothetical protein
MHNEKRDYIIEENDGTKPPRMQCKISCECEYFRMSWI